MDIQTETALGSLRKHLLKLKPTGPKGFEGLVADVMANLSGLVIRLAKSGLQGGRDGSSPRVEPFAVALECKRYKDDLRLEDLVGKVEIARHELGGDIDVWALGATSEVGDGTLAYLADILEEKGITLLALDWAARPLPPLAVFLAAAKSTTLHFFRQHAPKVSGSELSGLLDTIAADSDFAQQADKLKKALSAAHVGLGALREKNVQWLRERFHDRGLSRQTFGQYINITNAHPRERFSRRLDDLVKVDPDDIPLVAVLGDEGTGKTWLVAQWWANLSQPPVMLLVSGPRVEQHHSGQPLEFLARLLADQDGREDAPHLDSWRRRLERWKNHGLRNELRFLIVLDGLNERTAFPWADTINGLAREAQALGGLVIITSRKAYWERDVRPRLDFLAIHPLVVGDYNDQELAAVLKASGRSPDDLSPHVRAFIRNPRICSLALGLLDRIDQPVELTRERLLLEYWRARQKERGNGIVHNTGDFDKLLRLHAKSWLEQPHRSFDRDEWTKYSGIAEWRGPQTVQNDLCEIEEGRFLTISGHDSNTYEFRKETLPYALGLLINNELREEARKDRPDFNEALDKILDPVRGFDLVSEILAAATGLACLDETFPEAIRVCLIRAWLGLQNIPDAVVEAMCAYLAIRPEPFLDMAESPSAELDPALRAQTLISMMVHMRDHPTVHQALAGRLPRWLGCWSRNSVRPFRQEDEKSDNWAEKRRNRIDLKLDALHPEELDLFKQRTFELSEPTALLRDNVAELLLASRPLATYAGALVGWSMVQVVASDYSNAHDVLRWVVPLNHVDWEETKAGVLALIAHVNEQSSEPMRDSAALVLRLLGDRYSAERAAALSPRAKGRTWRLVANYCDTDPHDPDAPEGSNIANALTAAREISTSRIRTSFSATIEDYELERITPALARFRPQAIVDVLRAVAASAPNRSGMELRQISLLLPEISPLLDSASLTSVRQALNAVIADPNLITTGDARIVTHFLAKAIIPHHEPEEQLDTLLGLPPDTLLSPALRQGIAPLPPEVLSNRLEEAWTSHDDEQIHRILLFISSCKHELNETLRELLASAFASNDKVTANLAADAVLTADDPQMDLLLLGTIRKARIAIDSGTRAGHSLGRVVAASVIRHDRLDMIDLVPPAFLGHVADKLGGAALDRLAHSIDEALNRLLEPISAQLPEGMNINVEVSRDGLKTSRSVKIAQQPLDIHEYSKQLSEMNEPIGYIQRFRKDQEAMVAAADSFADALRRENAEYLLSHPPLWGLKKIVSDNPEKAAGWLQRILAVQDDWKLGQARNLGLVLAGAYAEMDSGLACEAFLRLKKASPMPPVNIVVGDAGVPLYEHALFSAALVPELEALRRQEFEDAFDDAALEQATMAAQAAGAGEWLMCYVQELTSSDHPGKQVRGLAVAGLMTPHPECERILSEDWGDGFLGDVAENARKNRRRAGWTRTWLEKAGKSENGIDFWRFCELARGVADLRALDVFDEQTTSSKVYKKFGALAKEKLKSAAKKRTEKRKKTLFGLNKPDERVVTMLRDILPSGNSCH
ncbi:hypothetical protein [Desulfolutivibrio sp.]|uniref:hypothetical protein n=1 Tax=Desulfolutivibrio sp. TaxID=2773296 RepID=UPI002F96DD21